MILDNLGNANGLANLRGKNGLTAADHKMECLGRSRTAPRTRNVLSGRSRSGHARPTGWIPLQDQGFRRESRLGRTGKMGRSLGLLRREDFRSGSARPPRGGQDGCGPGRPVLKGIGRSVSGCTGTEGRRSYGPAGAWRLSPGRYANVGPSRGHPVRRSTGPRPVCSTDRRPGDDAKTRLMQVRRSGPRLIDNN